MANVAYPQCEECKKRLYPSFDKGIHAALASSRTFGTGFRTYQCPGGKGWHTTSEKKSNGNGVQIRSR